MVRCSLVCCLAALALVLIPCRAGAKEPSLITWETRQLSDVFFSEGAGSGDFNNDGITDIVSGPFWYAGPDFKKSFAYYEPKPFDPLRYSDNFFAFSEDINGDGWTDILIYGFPGQDASWYENPQGREGLWPRYTVLDIVDNESPTFTDLTGDGRREIVCSSEGYFGYAEVNRDDPTAKWKFTRISDKSAGGKFTHGLGVGDVNGDGRMDLLEKTGWWEHPAGRSRSDDRGSSIRDPESREKDTAANSEPKPPAPTPLDPGSSNLDPLPLWQKHPFPFSGPGGAQMYAFDIDGDGDNDVLTSLAAHGYGLAWFESRRNDAGGIEFTRHDILGEHPEDNPYGVCFAQLHGVDVADIDGDGLSDIVTGKRWWAHGPKGDTDPNAVPVLYWLRLTRKGPGAQGVEFVPHLIDDDSGIGVEVKVQDVNGDDLPDVVVGNKKGTFVSIQSRKDVANLDYERHQPLRADAAAQARTDGLPQAGGLAPEAAAQAMTVPAGFKVQLAAGEPLVHQPVAFTIDERGRLWVAEAHTYPIRAPEGEGKDRIIILEDTDLDGTLDSRKVFIEGLNLVSGIEVGFGGVWVGAAPYLMFIPDKNRDDVPDGGASVEGRVTSVKLSAVSHQPSADSAPSLSPDSDVPQQNQRSIGGEGRGEGAVGEGRGAALPSSGLRPPSPLKRGEGLGRAAASGRDEPQVSTNTQPSTLNTQPNADIPPGAAVLLDGWGYQDTHETLNAFIWGPDGWLYGCQGVFTHSKVGKPGTPDEQRTPLNCCVWRYHPTRHQFEVFAHGSSNPWGVDFNDHGQAFITACVIPHMFHVIQGARYQRQGGQHFNAYTYDDIKTIADHSHYAGNIRDHAWWGRNEPVGQDDTHAAGGGHAHCGAMIYLGDNWPTQYRNTIFMANIHGNRINNDILKRDGSGFIASHASDFLFANDRWFRGINLKYGPDGSVYLIDWYDPNACHRIQPEIWDRTNGRIYRISYGDVQPRKVDLAAAAPQELAENHRHENEWYVRTSRRLLQEQAVKQKLPALNARRIIQDESGLYAAATMLDDMARRDHDTTRRLRALWTLHTLLPSLDPVAAARPLTAKGPDAEYLRGWGVQLELEDGQVENVLLKMLVDMAAKDPSPVVRRYLASGLQRLPPAQRWDIARNLLQHADDANDHNLPLMYWYAVEPLVPTDPDRALALAGESKIPLVAQFIYRRAAADEQALPKVLAAIGAAQDEKVQQTMLTEVLAVVKSSGQLPMPAGWPEVYARLSKSQNAELRKQAMFITVKFGDTSIFPGLRSVILEADGAEAKLNAIATLVAGKDPELPPLLHNLLGSPEMRPTALKALAAFNHPATADAILARYAEFTDAEKGDAIATLASRTPYARALLEAVETNRIPRADLKAFHVTQMQELKDEALLAKLNSVWGSIRSTPEEKLQQIAVYKRMLQPQQLAKADLPHGRELYAKNCGKCHKLFGDGGTIGPDITGSNRANLDYILQNMVDPSALVGKDYQTTSIITRDGRVLNGLTKEENASAVTLQTTTDVVVVDKSDIEERKLSELSLMPEGQLKDWPTAHVQDLVAYLAGPRQVPLPGSGPVYDEATQRVPGALEGEALTVVRSTAGAARSQKMGGFSKAHWSGTDQLWWTGAKPGDALVLEFPVAVAGRYELFAAMTKARDYGIVQLTLDDQPLGGPIDLYNHPDVITTGPVSLGALDLTAGHHQLTVSCTGAHPDAAKAYMFGLDYLYLGRTTSP